MRAGGIPCELFTGNVDLIGTSDDRGAPKLEPESFRRVAKVTPFENYEILYASDRVDNDIRPAVATDIAAGKQCVPERRRRRATSVAG